MLEAAYNDAAGRDRRVQPQHPARRQPRASAPTSGRRRSAITPGTTRPSAASRCTWCADAPQTVRMRRLDLTVRLAAGREHLDGELVQVHARVDARDAGGGRAPPRRLAHRRAATASRWRWRRRDAARRLASRARPPEATRERHPDARTLLRPRRPDRGGARAVRRRLGGIRARRSAAGAWSARCRARHGAHARGADRRPGRARPPRAVRARHRDRPRGRAGRPPGARADRLVPRHPPHRPDARGGRARRLRAS